MSFDKNGHHANCACGRYRDACVCALCGRRFVHPDTLAAHLPACPRGNGP